MIFHPAPRIFISYSRKDGAEFAYGLRRELEAEGHSIWQDLVALGSGPHWWSQIEEALRSKALEHFVLVLTPGAMESSVVRREIRLARQEGKTVSVVRGPGIADDFHAVPRWIGHVFFFDLPEQRERFLNGLRGPGKAKRVPMMAPEPPADFAARPREFGSLRAKLLDAKGDAIAITAALKGAGGYGKTTLAKALAHDDDIQDAFYDGILWVELGERPENLLSVLSDLVEILSGERPGVETLYGAATKFGESLGDSRILLVIDDVWREQDLRPFLQGGRNTTRLITTRIDRVLPLGTEQQPVDAMRSDEALALLAAGLEDRAAEQRPELAKLAARLGEWAQLLKLVNGFLRERVLKGRQSLAEALTGVNKRLDAKGLVAFDARNETERTKAVARTIGVSLDLRDENGRARFAELGVFPEDTDVPIGIVERLWQETGSLDEADTEDLLSDFANLSLLLTLNLEQKTLRLHDTVRHFLQLKLKQVGLTGNHRHLLAALDGVAASAVTDDPTRRYYYQHLPYHLAAAAEAERLDALLINPGWLNAKLAALHSPPALVGDYENYAKSEFVTLIGRALKLSMGICVRDERQLIPQIVGRLMMSEAAELSDFCDRARSELVRPSLLPFHLGLTPPGTEIARLEGHQSWVNALCVLPGGRLASASNDCTIRLWDVQTGAEVARLKGHVGRVNALCVLPDGRLASASSDKTIRLWDVAAGGEAARLQGRRGWGRALCVLPDSRVASASYDGAIRLWDVVAGDEAGRLLGHQGWVNELCLLPDGRCASAGSDGTIRLWDVAASAETARFQVHEGSIRALCLLPDGRLASAADDGTIRLWDVAAGAEAARLKGHEGRIRGLCVLPHGRLASAADDGTIRLWDVAAGAEAARPLGHEDEVTALCVLPGGGLASAADDGTIRLWNVAAGAEAARPLGHEDEVNALCVLPDGRLASAADDDRTIRLWDVAAGAQARLEGHGGRVNSLCLLPDGRLASAANDRIIRLWDVTISSEAARLEGHGGRVNSLCVLPGGRLASAADDRTIRLWDVAAGVQAALIESDWGRPHVMCALPDGRLASASGDKIIQLWDVAAGAEAARLEGNQGLVNALCVLPDGRLASAGSDGTNRLWDVAVGAAAASLQGHGNWVKALCVLPDGRLASAGGNGTIRLWDVAAGAQAARLEGHEGEVNALCVLRDGRLASASGDRTIRLWDVAAGAEAARLEVDASAVTCLIAISANQLVAGDVLGRLHWVEVVD